MLSGLGATMAQGFAFGTGSAVAKVAVGSVMDAMGGSKEAAPAPAAPAAPTGAASSACEIDNKAFMQCLNDNNGSMASCDYYYTALQACQQRQ